MKPSSPPTCPLCHKPLERFKNGRPKPCPCTFTKPKDRERWVKQQTKRA